MKFLVLALIVQNVFFNKVCHLESKFLNGRNFPHQLYCFHDWGFETYVCQKDYALVKLTLKR